MLLVITAMSALDRHTKMRPAGRPPERHKRGRTTRHRAFIPSMLWVFLFLALAAPIASAQSTTSSAVSATPTQTLSIAANPAIINLPPINSTRPAIQLSFPPSADLFLTFNLCSLTSNASLIPTVLISTAAEPAWALGTRSISDPGSGGTREGGYNRRSRGGGVWSLSWDKGFGNWTIVGLEGRETVKVLISLAIGADGAIRPVSGVGNMGVQLGVSSSNPLHRLSTRQPLLGDTTSTTALIFSSIIHHLARPQPVYPNYTLPPAQLPFTPMPAGSSNPNLSLILVPTETSPTNEGLDNSLCAVRSANVSTGGIANPRNAVLNRTSPNWMRLGGDEGFRVAWGVGDLVAGGANYTAWILDAARGELSRPIWLATKQGEVDPRLESVHQAHHSVGFMCPLVLPTSFCPSIAYAAPLSPNPSNPTHPLSSLPDNITSLLTSNLNSLSTSLLTTACGRDRYSYASSCADCYAAYRDWVCRMLIPRCASGVPSSSDPAPMVIRRTADNPRLSGVPLLEEYDELLPCLSTCNAVDRACPINLNFRCPLRRHGAARSYAFVGNTSDHGDGSADLGVPASDRWGNAWCNG